MHIQLHMEEHMRIHEIRESEEGKCEYVFDSVRNTSE